MRHIRRSLLLTLLLFLLAVGGSVSMAYDLQVENFRVQMEVQENNSYDIREFLEVTFNRSDMHGIFRDIPLRTYYDKPVDISDVAVPGHSYETSRENGHLRLKIGDPDTFVSQRMTYEILYNYEVGDDRNPELDELYFNIVGPSWQMPIQRTEFEITMPKAFDTSALNFTYGSTGSTANDAVTYRVEGNRIIGSLDRVLYPGEALTVALPLPEGYYTEVEEETFLWATVLKFYPVLILLLAGLGGFLFKRYGRNDPIYPTVEFYPPEGLTPAEIGYIYDGEVDSYDLTAMLVYWADQGYLKIIEQEEEEGVIFKKTKNRIYLEKLKDLPGDRRHFETTYFNDLFDEYALDNVVDIRDLKDSFYKTIGEVKMSLAGSFTGDASRRVYSRSGKGTTAAMIFFGFLLFLLVGLGMAHLVAPFDLGIGAILGGIGAFVFTLIFAGAGSSFYRAKKRLPGDRIKTYAIGILMTIFGVVLLSLVFTVGTVHWSFYPAAFFAVALMYLAPHASKRTKQGDIWMAHLLGFKGFMENAEKDRIETLVTEDPAYFYHILPYAMVLGVTDKWAKQFESIALDAPDWYDNQNRVGTFSAVYFASHLNAETQAVSQTMTSAPSSSGGGGSFGGGSAGGGSGGGGGGGW